MAHLTSYINLWLELNDTTLLLCTRRKSNDPLTQIYDDGLPLIHYIYFNYGMEPSPSKYVMKIRPRNQVCQRIECAHVKNDIHTFLYAKSLGMQRNQVHFQM